VLGLVAACMGILRSDTERLLALADGTRVHIRVDSPGTPLVDDQTIQDNPNASLTRKTIQSKRTYLCDASFVAVVVPGPQVSVESIARAAEQPIFQPFLGRRSCVLSSNLLVSHEVRGADPLSLFDGIESGPTEVLQQLMSRDSYRAGTGASDEPGQDFYLDVPDYPGALRRVPIRDHLSGPLQRQWRERFAVHVRRPQLTHAP
jgi:CRISPR-associated protein Cas5/CasD subtype I-E